MAVKKPKARRVSKHWLATPLKDIDKELKRELVTDLERLKAIIADHTTADDKPLEYEVAFDFETTGFNSETEDLVGFSFAFDGVVGYYVPVGHKLVATSFNHSCSNPDCESKGETYILTEDDKKDITCRLCQTELVKQEGEFSPENLAEVLPGGTKLLVSSKRAVVILYDLIKNAKAVYVYNYKFECKWMEKFDFDMSLVPVWDVMLMVWLMDSNVAMPSLKDSSYHYLGLQQQTFMDVVSQLPIQKYEFLTPEQSYSYGCDDSSSTFRLGKELIPILKAECSFILNLDNALLYPMIQWEKYSQKLDAEYLQNLKDTLTEKIKDLEREIVITVGYEFNINSSKQLSTALEKLGLHTGENTKTGYMSTNSKLLAKLKHPFAKKVVAYKSHKKILSSYVETLLKFTDRETCRFNYHLMNVPTGRMSGGSPKEKNTYYAPYNVQSTPANKSIEKPYWVVKDDKPGNILGWSFYPQDDCPDDIPKTKEIVAGDNTINIRRAFLPAYENHKVVSIDFSQQEGVAVANMSGETVWLEAFKTGGDIHNSSARAIFPMAKDITKSMRQMGKTINFAVIYGGTEFTIAMQLDISKAEAKGYLQRWKKKHPKLVQFFDISVREGRAKGTVYTFFGRPRRVAEYFKTGDFRTQSFGERTCINTRIQGTGADILKITLLRFWKFLNGKKLQGLTKEPRPYKKNEIQFLSTLHDEVNLSIRDDILSETLDSCIEIMEFKIKGWDVQLSVNAEIGNNWGELFKFKRLDTGEWLPDYKDMTKPTEESEPLFNEDDIASADEALGKSAEPSEDVKEVLMSDGVYNIWSEGFSATGEAGVATFHGRSSGMGFLDACVVFANSNPAFKKDFDPELMTYWGCKLFNNEADARRSFG